jgi:hypothetical protein
MMIRCFKISLLTFSLLISLLPSPAWTQNPTLSLDANTVLPTQRLQADVALLRKALEELHPGLYRYRTRQEMDAAFDTLAQGFNQDQTLASVFLRLSRFTASIRCGHTWPSFFNQSKSTSSALFVDAPRLPFFWIWTGDGRMIVTRDFSDAKALPRGTEIVSINHIPSRTLLAKLLPLARADGTNDAKRVAQMNVQGVDTYEAADIYLPLLVADWNTAFYLQVKLPGAKTSKRITVAGVSSAARMEEAKGLYPDMSGPGPLFEARTLTDRAVLLRMPDWAVFNSKWDWKSWLNETLDHAAANNAPALIVDLRGNEGGLDEVGDVLLSHLRGNKPIPALGYARLVRYRSISTELRPYLSTWDKSIVDWGERVSPAAVRWPTAPPIDYFRRVDDDAAGSTAPEVHSKFLGRVFVLIDASNSSATFNFSRAVQQEHLGLLVGEPTGGSLRGINGGAFVFLKLPGSGIEVDLPLVGTFPTTPQPGRGLLPDVAVHPSRNDILTDRDPVMEVVTKLLERT